MEESSDGFWHLKIEARKSTGSHLSDQSLTTMNGGIRIWHNFFLKDRIWHKFILWQMIPLHACRFAAQVFHGLYDEVMSTSARGHGLMLRVQQLEAELPLLEKESCQRDYLYIASNRGGFHTSTSFSFTAHPSLATNFSENKIFFLFAHFTKPPFCFWYFGLFCRGWLAFQSEGGAWGCDKRRHASLHHDVHQALPRASQTVHAWQVCAMSYITSELWILKAWIINDGCSIVRLTGMISVARGRAWRDTLTRHSSRRIRHVLTCCRKGSKVREDLWKPW